MIKHAVLILIMISLLLMPVENATGLDVVELLDNDISDITEEEIIPPEIPLAASLGSGDTEPQSSSPTESNMQQQAVQRWLVIITAIITAVSVFGLLYIRLRVQWR